MSASWSKPLRRIAWYAKSSWAFHRARGLGLVGQEFFRFGRTLGWELVRKEPALAWDLLVRPVSSTRYFEFTFARDCLTADPGACLDISSPMLFDFYVARRYPSARLHVTNPDSQDMKRTHACLSHLTMPPIQTGTNDIANLPLHPGGYDTIWSISVIEHIQSENESDSTAVTRMFEALRPGGRLILTVPTDKSFQIEYRDVDHYGTQSTSRTQTAGSYFFQRIYDEAAIQERLINPLRLAPARVAWYGERTPGRFNAYIRQWLREGKSLTVWDPLEMAHQYRAYDTWAAMPGAGVCGLLFIKP